MVEIFDHRIEMTNTGKPLVDPQRFLDTPPQSRNEALAAFLRRIKVCEERGSGIDKIMQAIETHHYPLPEPQFDINKSYMTRASLRQRLHCSDNAAKQVIGQTCEKSLLRLANPEAKRNFQYLPYWA